MDTSKVLMVKFGWSENYDGSDVTGDHTYLSEKPGAERFNFMPSEGTYYGYIPPGGIVPTAVHKDVRGWTVFFVAKRPSKTGLHLVGWYENADLENARSTYKRLSEKVTYSVTASTAYLVPNQSRTNSFSNEHVKSLAFTFLRGKKDASWKVAVLRHLLADVTRVRSSAAKNPS